MANQDGRDVGVLGMAQQPAGDLANLKDRAGRARDVRMVQRLDRIDGQDLGPHLGRHGQHPLGVGLAEQMHAVAGDAQALGAQLGLMRGLLPRDVQDLTRARQSLERHQEERGLPDAGIPAQQDEGARHQSPAQHAIELADPGGRARRGIDLNGGERLGNRPRRGPSAGSDRVDQLLDQCSPGLAVGAPAQPLGALVAAGLTGMDEASFGHESVGAPATSAVLWILGLAIGAPVRVTE